MIVKTLLDTDLYKFTTSYAYIKLFPYAMGTFSFNDRNETKYTEAFLETLKAEIKNLSQLRFTEEELEYMTKNCRFLPRVYWEWLSSFRFDPNKIDIHLDEACHLHIEVAAFAPIAEFKKLTASLLTPTDRSKAANMNKKITRLRKTISIFMYLFN